MKNSITALLLFTTMVNYAQIDTITFIEESSLQFPVQNPAYSSFTSLFDRNNQPYVYSANMEYGLEIYDISVTGTITNSSTLVGSVFNNMDVSTVEQIGNLLFVGLGDFQVRDNFSSGLAILDVSNPLIPIIKDVWDSTFFTNGVSHLLIEGNYAYLSMMHQGLTILDVSNPINIKFISNILPDTTIFPDFTDANQARGLVYRNDSIFLCYDSGGLRVIDVSVKSAPIEVYEYVDTNLTSQARSAYNDIFIKGNYAFISVDYCGLEILDISTIPYSVVQWDNPWGCNSGFGCSTGNWSGSEIHTNEIKTANNDSLLFISSGQTDLFVYDISDPVNTSKVGELININDAAATHGIDVLNNKVMLSYLYSPIFICGFTPFSSTYGGLKIFDYSVLILGIDELSTDKSIVLYPNPVEDQLTIQSESKIKSIKIYDLFGRLIKTIFNNNTLSETINIVDLTNGLYIANVTSTKRNINLKFIKK